ncbi:hypothetical protein B0H13DRAFT_1862048 [Mycena leptocephala]|nr:hypothetical protein B0H13DRAFT_1862048 [Mycena leptocephala]
MDFNSTNGAPSVNNILLQPVVVGALNPIFSPIYTSVEFLWLPKLRQSRCKLGWLHYSRPILDGTVDLLSILIVRVFHPDLGEQQTCGSEACIKQVQGPDYQRPPIQTNIAETHLERAASTARRFGTGPTMSKRPPPGTSFDTNALLHHEHGGGNQGEDKVTIAWAVARESKAPKQTNADLGTSAKKWAVSLPLPVLFISDIKAQLVTTMNIEWGRSNSVLLLNEEVTFRWHGSKLLEPNTANMTLGQFYAFYSTPSRAPIYLSNVPTIWKAVSKASKSHTVCLELYIDSKMFQTRLELLEGSSSSSSSMMSSALASVARKRTLSSVSEGANRNDIASKRPAPMKSTFVPTNSSSITLHQRSSVTLREIICIADASTGEAEFEETAESVSSAISHAYFSRILRA